MKRKHKREALFLLGVIAASYVVSHCFIGIARIHGSSMEPTLHDGQWVALWRFANDSKVGDIVITNSDNLLDTVLVKRVIAIEGQHLAISADGSIVIDGVLLNEPYLKDLSWNGCELEMVVPDDMCFLMGDNRNFSADSREIGCLPSSNIQGRVIIP